jgi:transportin-1
VVGPNKRVQRAACHALNTLEENSGPGLVPYFELIASLLGKGLRLYEHKDSGVLYQTIGSVSDAVGQRALQDTQYADILMPLLMERLFESKKKDTKFRHLIQVRLTFSLINTSSLCPSSAMTFSVSLVL